MRKYLDVIKKTELLGPKVSWLVEKPWYVLFTPYSLLFCTNLVCIKNLLYQKLRSYLIEAFVIHISYVSQSSVVLEKNSRKIVEKLADLALTFLDKICISAFAHIDMLENIFSTIFVESRLTLENLFFESVILVYELYYRKINNCRNFLMICKNLRNLRIDYRQ